jgi:major intracellular serine protease
LDTGVNPSHAEIIGKVFQGRNFASDMAPGYYDETDTDDVHGHGTFVATESAGQVFAGVAPEAKILPVKVLDDNGMLWNVEWLVNGMNFAKDWVGPNGEKVDIVNMSLCGTGWTSSEIAAVDAAARALMDAGILVVCAAGNSGDETVQYPANLPTVTAVGAVDVKRQIAYYSSQGYDVDLCQNGVDIYGADAKTGGYILMSGTSMAAPIISGIAALAIGKAKSQVNPYDEPFTDREREKAYYKSLKLLALDLGVAGSDKVYGAGYCTFNQRPPIEVAFQLGSQAVTVNGVTKTMNAPAYAYQMPTEKVTEIPERFFADTFMLATRYEDATKKIYVTG